MAFLSVRVLAPTIGKSALALERARAFAEIYKRHGAGARLAKVAAGDGAGQIVVGTSADNGKALAHIFEQVQADPAFTRLVEEREKNPAGVLMGPEVYRILHGQLQHTRPVVLLREYAVARDKVAGLMAIIPELDAVLQPHDVKLAMLSPVFSTDMSRLVAAYYFTSPAHLGTELDGVGASPEFQSIVAKAAAFGTLARSRVLLNV